MCEKTRHKIKWRKTLIYNKFHANLFNNKIKWLQNFFMI